MCCKGVDCSWHQFCKGCHFCLTSCNYRCTHCFYICHRDLASITFINRILKGLELPQGLNQKEKDFPLVIPVIIDPLKKQLPFSHVCFHAGRLLRANCSDLPPRLKNRDIRDYYKLNPETEIGLHFFVPDGVLANFWSNRLKLYKHFQKFDFIFAPNFSVYDDSPRLEHLINIKRSALVFKELIEEGFYAIPDISWYNIEDLKRWLDFFNSNTIKTFAFSLQSVSPKMRSRLFWLDGIIGLDFLLKNLKESKHIVIIGCDTSIIKMQLLKKIQRNHKFTFISNSSYMLSRKGNGFSLSSEEAKKLDKTTLFWKNFCNIEEKIKQILLA